MHEFELDTPLGRIAGLRGGQSGAPRVLALHGWLDNAASFVPLAEHLHGIDLVAPDLPGHGASAHLPPGADYSFAAAVNAVLDVADALGWDRFALLGHSMGAGISSLVAAACPQRVERLVAIEALGALAEVPERTVSRLRDAVAAMRALPGKSLRVFPDPTVAARARMVAGAQVGSRLSESASKLLVERGVMPVEGGFVWSSDPRLTLPSMQRLTESQVRDLVAGIECPTRVIFASPAQSYLPDELRRERAGLLPRGELIVLEGGHHLHMEDPALVAAAIGDFLTVPRDG
ncbi:alpha/beta hydrolase [Lysobacter sp. S4-A87]|uniref:alpha/beta fold hydrolase n=1 Tax=Lysobacter sp. S4-A87 TaxID=2925843 RepID=UPI001F53270D|nr:alpha/beta hydrolase [Lysobacter sp. S4-A87]UNK48367.1 alpha/beta hydrolase [Lysobacter sp. S4-A87]